MAFPSFPQTHRPLALFLDLCLILGLGISGSLFVCRKFTARITHTSEQLRVLCCTGLKWHSQVSPNSPPSSYVSGSSSHSLPLYFRLIYLCVESTPRAARTLEQRRPLSIPTQPTQYPHEILYNPIDKPRRDSKTQYMLMRVGFTSKRDIQNFRAVGNLLRAQRDRLFAAVNALTKSEDFLSELHEQRELKKRNPSRLQPLAL